MKISALQEYGLRCLLQLASHTVESPLTIRDIAQRESLTTDYVAKILVTLRRAGLVKSLRGVHGGYVLARPAKDISVAETLGALGRLDMGRNHCKRFPGTRPECTHIGNCGIRPVLGILTQHIFQFLSGLNLGQLVQDEAAVTREVTQLSERMPAPAGAPIFLAKRG